MEWVFRHTPEHHWAPKTHWNIPVYPKTITKSPIHLQGCIRRKQTDKQPTDTDRQQEILVSMYDWVNLELTHYFGKTLKSQDCFHLTLLRHQIIKTSLCTISKNSWVLPFLVNLTPVTMKLQLTVFLDHPVAGKRTFSTCARPTDRTNSLWPSMIPAGSQRDT